MVEDITPEYDYKLNQLLNVVARKIENPINPGNKKIINSTENPREELPYLLSRDKTAELRGVYVKWLQRKAYLMPILNCAMNGTMNATILYFPRMSYLTAINTHGGWTFYGNPADVTFNAYSKQHYRKSRDNSIFVMSPNEWCGRHSL